MGARILKPFKIGTHSKCVSSEVQILNGSVLEFLELSGIVKAIAMFTTIRKLDHSKSRVQFHKLVHALLKTVHHLRPTFVKFFVVQS